MAMPHLLKANTSNHVYSCTKDVYVTGSNFAQAHRSDPWMNTVLSSHCVNPRMDCAKLQSKLRAKPSEDGANPCNLIIHCVRCVRRASYLVNLLVRFISDSKDHVSLSVPSHLSQLIH